MNWEAWYERDAFDYSSQNFLCTTCSTEILLSDLELGVIFCPKCRSYFDLQREDIFFKTSWFSSYYDHPIYGYGIKRFSAIEPPRLEAKRKGQK